MKEYWQTVPFGSLAEFKNGLNYSKENIGAGLKIVGVSDFQNHSFIKYDDLCEVSGFEGIDNSYLLQEDDLLFVRSNGNKNLIGRVLLIKDLNNEKVTFSGFTIRARITSSKVLPAYAALLFSTPEIKARLFAEGGGTNIANLNQGMLAMMAMPLPEIDEQERIVTFATTWDEALTLQTRKLQQLRKRKKEVAFRLMSGNKRLKGFTGEWHNAILSEFFARLTIRNAVGNTNVLTISAQQGLVSQTRYFNKSIASEEVSTYYLLNRGDFAYNKSYSAGYPMGVIKPLKQYDQGIVSPLYICMRPITADGDFFEHYFEAGMLNRGISRIAQEGARNHGLLNVSARDFMELDVRVPEANERRAIAEVLNTADAEIRLEEGKLAALREQKRGLLHQLLTGQLRLS